MSKDNAAYEPLFKPLWTAGEPPMNLWTSHEQRGFCCCPAWHHTKRGWELVPRMSHGVISLPKTWYSGHTREIPIWTPNFSSLSWKYPWLIKHQCWAVIRNGTWYPEVLGAVLEDTQPQHQKNSNKIIYQILFIFKIC